MKNLEVYIVFGTLSLICILILYYMEISSKERQAKQEKLNAENCKLFIGKKIIDKQIPKYLVFDNKKYLIVKQELFNRKNIGDTFNEEDCNYLDSDEDGNTNPAVSPMIIPQPQIYYMR